MTKTVLKDLPTPSPLSDKLQELSPTDLDLVRGGMRCDEAGTAPTYDNEKGVCKSVLVLVCG